MPVRNARRSPLPMIVRLIGLVLVVVALQVVMPGTRAQAATNPQILIAVDATSPSCAYFRSPGNHTHSGDNTWAHGPVSATRLPCPAGTIIVTATIPLSQAKMSHEAYVQLLSPQASSNQRTQWEEQVHQLIQAKRRSLQANQTIRPLTTCGYSASIYSGYQVIFNDYLQGRVDYYVSSNCSQVFLDTAYVDAGYVPINNSVWWEEFDYSYYRTTCNPPNDLLYPNTTYSLNPYIWESRGLDAVWKYENEGSICYGQGLGEAQESVGPLN